MAEPEPEDKVYDAVVVVQVLHTTLAEIIVALGEGNPNESIDICNRGKETLKLNLFTIRQLI